MMDWMLLIAQSGPDRKSQMSPVEETAAPQAPPKTKLKEIPLAEIRENPVALRSIDKTAEGYAGLVDSIREKGVLNPIVVREVRNDDGSIVYGLVDGLQRYTASQDAGRATIPAQVVALNDAEVLEAQVIANVHRVVTKPFQYSKQLMRILAGNPTMTIAELATRLSMSPSWLSDRLGLVKLAPELAELVDAGTINLSNAYAIAKLPPEEQVNFIDRAITMLPQEFVPNVNQRAKEIRDARRQGRSPEKQGFVAIPHAQKIGDLKLEYEAPTIGPALIAETNARTPLDGWRLALSWALHMDPRSIEVARQRHEEREAAEAAEKEKQRREREEAKQRKAVEAQVAAKETAAV